MTVPAADQARRGPVRVIAVAALSLVLCVLVLLVALYAGRRQIAREAVTGWLRSRGIASETEFQELAPGHLVGRIRIGSPRAPDLVVDRAEVTYSLGGLISGQGVQVTSVRLVRPVLKASIVGGRFSAGGLDRLIAEFRRRPPRPGAPSPRIRVDQGLLLLMTDAGPVRASLDATFDNGKLLALDAATTPMRLAHGDIAADLGRANLRVRSAGGRMTANLRAPFARLASGGRTASDGVAVLSFEGGYPDLAQATMLRGAARVEFAAAKATGQGVASGPLQVTAVSPDVSWTRTGGERLAGGLKVTAQARALAVSDLRLASAAGGFEGDFVLGQATALRLTGGAEGHGAWTGLAGPVAGDSAEIAAVKRGLRAFHVSAQGVRLQWADGTLRTGLSGAVRLLPQRGGEVRLVPAGAGYRLTSAGGGLPEVEADVRRVAFTPQGLTASGAIKAALSIGPVRNGLFRAAGDLRIAKGEARFFASGCAELSADRIELGANDVETLSGRLCPQTGALAQIGPRGWIVGGRLEKIAAKAPFLQVSVREGEGSIGASDFGHGLAGALRISGAHVSDGAKDPRFHPLRLGGGFDFAHGDVDGHLEFRTPKGDFVATGALRHDGNSGVGDFNIATGLLTFRPGGLQPADISPVAQAVGSAFDGQAALTGGVHWTKAGVVSRGDVALHHLSFKSPLGEVTDAAGGVTFTSLDPLVSAPGQRVVARKLASALPLTNLDAEVAFRDKALVVERAEADAGGGKLRVSALSAPLGTDQPIRGTVYFEGVQLHDLVEASPFGDRVDLDARVSGRIPFESQAGQVRISGGELHAIAPGRLSISRAALTSVSAQGSVEAPGPAAAQIGDTDTFTDFAYQALENLAFDKLDAGLGTRSDGRLGVLFHIVGYHDPPQHQEITISWLDLIRRKFLGKKLPLPSGTGVDLTLDTTLNLDDLLKDYGEFERLRSSPPVQR